MKKVDGIVYIRCGWCGGHGMVHGYDGDPTDCTPCGYSGWSWPPRDEKGRFVSRSEYERAKDEGRTR